MQFWDLLKIQAFGNFSDPEFGSQTLNMFLFFDFLVKARGPLMGYRNLRAIIADLLMGITLGFYAMTNPTGPKKFAKIGLIFLMARPSTLGSRLSTLATLGARLSTLGARPSRPFSDHDMPLLGKA